MKISQQIAELVIGHLRGGHVEPAVKNGLRQALIGGRGAGGHGRYFGYRLQPRPIQRASGGGVVASGASLLKDLGTACLFDGPLGLGFGGR